MNKSNSTKKFLWFTVVLLMVAAFLCEKCYFRGVLIPLRVTGTSMAPTLIGHHFEVDCPYCQFHFTLDAEPLSPEESLPHTDTVRCPNCGKRMTGIEKLSVCPGERIVLNYLAYWFRDPRRFELIAFPHPANSKKLCVKRVVGLPGETIQFVRGELWINGVRLEMSPMEYRSQRIEIPAYPLVTDRGVTDELPYLRSHAPKIAEQVVPTTLVEEITEGKQTKKYRNLVFRPPLGILQSRGFDTPVTLGDNEYFVIGDNQLLSEDSRSWTTSDRSQRFDAQNGAILRSSIMGRVSPL